MEQADEINAYTDTVDLPLDASWTDLNLNTFLMYFCIVFYSLLKWKSDRSVVNVARMRLILTLNTTWHDVKCLRYTEYAAIDVRGGQP